VQTNQVVFYRERSVLIHYLCHVNVVCELVSFLDTSFPTTTISSRAYTFLVSPVILNSGWRLRNKNKKKDVRIERIQIGTSCARATKSIRKRYNNVLAENSVICKILSFLLNFKFQIHVCQFPKWQFLCILRNLCYKCGISKL
jgi:hypothetical protein